MNDLPVCFNWKLTFVFMLIYAMELELSTLMQVNMNIMNENEVRFL